MEAQNPLPGHGQALPPSLWQLQGLPYPHAGTLPRQVDVAIVGGGLVGLALARCLLAEGRRPVMLEARHLGWGASARNGGLLLPGTAELYGPLVARWGRERARSLWALAESGGRELAAWMEELARAGRDPLWRPEGGLHVAADTDQAADLRRDARWLAEDGLTACRWLERDALSTYSDIPLPKDVQGALLHSQGGPLHSGRLVTGAAADLVDKGLVLMEGCEVASVNAGAGGVGLRLADGRELRAQAAVLAANAWAGRLLPAPLDRVITPVRGQVLATEPLPPRRIRGAWSLNEGYEYLQQLPDGRVVLGGLRPAAADREVGRAEPALNPQLQTGLVDWLRRTWPDLALPPAVVAEPGLRRWAGVMAFTPDRLPLIGPVPDMPGLWLAAGFNGHGLPFAPLAARWLAGAIAGRDLPDEAAPFLPERWLAGWDTEVVY